MPGPRRIRARRFRASGSGSGGSCRGRRGTIFFRPTYMKYAEIVSLKSPGEARRSASALRREFDAAETRAKKVRVKRVTVLAMNRAKVASANPRLSAAERREAAEIRRIYQNASESMKL